MRQKLEDIEELILDHCQVKNNSNDEKSWHEKSFIFIR